MTRREFSREFKREAVLLIRQRGVSVTQAVRDLDLHATVLRRWIREFGDSPDGASSGKGQMRPEDE